MKLIPHLTLCELVRLEEAAPQLERTIKNHSNVFGVSIEKCCLDHYSLLKDKEVYLKFDSIYKVTMKNLSEADARGVLALFKNIDQFAMHNMSIFEDISDFPMNLSELKLIDCKIEKKLMDEWMRSGSLVRLCLEDVRYYFPMVLPDKIPSIYRSKICDHANFTEERYEEIDKKYFHYSFQRLISLSIRGNIIDCDIGGWELQFILKNRQIVLYQPGTWPSKKVDDKFVLFRATSHPPNWYNKQNHPRCEYVLVMSMDPGMVDLDGLEIKTVVAHYVDDVVAVFQKHIYEPPSVPNLIFEKLNEYCLLEIVEYLSVYEWLRLGMFHWKMQSALVSYKIPRADIEGVCIRYLETDYFNHIAPFITKLHSDNHRLLNKLPSLRSWTTKGPFSSDLIATFPDGLEELVLENEKEHMNLGPFFRKISPTLKVLEFQSYPGVECLSEFHNLRGIKISNDFPPGEVRILLKQNKQLQRVHIIFVKEYSWFLTAGIARHICALKELKDLAFRSFSPDDDERSMWKTQGVLSNLLERVGSKLIKLSLPGIGIGPKLLSLAKRGLFTNIQEFILEIPVYRADKKYLLPIILSMTSVRKLLILVDSDFSDDYEYDDDSDFNDDDRYTYDIVADLVSLIKCLPSLIELELPGKEYEFRIVMELREELKKTNRRIRINESKL